MKRMKRKANAMIMSVILLVVLLALGVIVGAVAVRDHLTQEFGDAAVALDHLDQSFSYRIAIDPDGPGGIPETVVAEAQYLDLYDTALPLIDLPNQPPARIEFVPPNNEESPVVFVPGPFP